MVDGLTVPPLASNVTVGLCFHIAYTDNGSETFEKGNNVVNKYINSSTQVITNEDHTLYAVWEKN